MRLTQPTPHDPATMQRLASLAAGVAVHSSRDGVVANRQAIDGARRRVQQLQERDLPLIDRRGVTLHELITDSLRVEDEQEAIQRAVKIKLSAERAHENAYGFEAKSADFRARMARLAARSANRPKAAAAVRTAANRTAEQHRSQAAKYK